MRNRVLYRSLIVVLMVATMTCNLVMTVFLQRFFYGDLKVEDPATLHRVASSLGRGYLAYNDYWDVAESTDALDSISANFVEPGVAIYAGDQPFWSRVSWTTGSFGEVIGRFTVVGGRFLAAADDDPAAPRVAVVNTRTWEQLGGGSRFESGRQLLIKGEFFEVIGVVDNRFPGLDYMEDVDVWAPALQNPLTWQYEVDDYQEYQVLARVDPAMKVVAEEQLDAALSDIEDRLGFVYTADLLTETEYRLKRRPMMYRLFMALATVTGFLFVLGVVNQGLMLVTRSVALSHELKVMSALGARVRHVLARFLHGFFLLLGLSLVLVFVFSTLILHLYNIFYGDRHGAIELHSLLQPLPMTVLFGMVILLLVLHIGFPLLTFLRLGENVFSRERSSGSLFSAKSRLSLAGVVCQITLVMMAILGCAAFLNTLVEKGSVRSGPYEDRLIHVEMVLAGRTVPGPDEIQARLGQIESALLRLGGVESMGTSNAMPLHSGGWTRALVEGKPLEKEPEWINFAFVGPGYFDTVGVDLLSGRDFRKEDAFEYPWSHYIINKAYAGREFPDREPLGNRVAPWDGVGFGDVIAVVENQPQSISGETLPTIYIPSFLERFILSIRLADRSLIRSLRQPLLKTITGADAGVIILRTETIDSIWDESLASSRLGFLVLASLSLAGLLLSLSGVYGYQGYTVSLREREFAIRNCVGASISRLYWREIKRGLLMIMGGQVVGIVGFLIALRIFATAFFPLHLPLTGAAVVTMLLMAGFIAVVAGASLPVRRPKLAILMRE